MSNPTISIVIPVVDNLEVTKKCFDSIRKHTKLPYELIWVDNASSETCFTVLKRFVVGHKIPCRVIRNKSNLGFVRGTNQGIKIANGKYVILLNNDTEVYPNWDTSLIKPFQEQNDVGAVGVVTQSKLAWQTATQLRNQFKLDLPRFEKGKKEEYAELLYNKYKNKYMVIEKLPLAFFCTAIEKSTIDKIGSLCEEIHMGLGDDDEYCMRLRYYGYKLLLSLGTFVYHAHRTTFRSLKMGEAVLRKRNTSVLRRKAIQYGMTI